MYGNEILKTHIDQTPTIDVESLVYAEINMNDASNINVIGNYRNRPTVASPTQANFGVVATAFDVSDSLQAFTGATDADIVVDGSYLQDDLPVTFVSINQKQQLLYSLEECFGKFRPRSGINKAAYFPGHYSHNVNSKMMSRPRYYIAGKDDKFKYWTSFRTEQNPDNLLATIERGVSKEKVSGQNQWYIDDAAPFITYKESIPVNRIIVKMQTNVGTETIGNISDGTTTRPDPLYDEENVVQNRTVPINWKIQYLDPTTNTWSEVMTFPNAANTLVNRDGYLELQYSGGTWSVAASSIDVQSPLFTDFNNPASTDIKYIKGLRIVVNTMSKEDSTFDLIELSPRLAMNISSMTTGYSVSKVASDLGVSGMPVGQLLASTGSIQIADYDEALNTNNPDSVIANYIKKNIQIKFYEIIKNVGESNDSWYVPIKTMYAESFPDINSKDRTATIALRDFYFYFESVTAPEMLIKDASFSYAIASLFDSVGYSNYIYLRSNVDDDPIIPYFYVAPNSTVAETLQALAISTQTAMFFDEYNNLVLMSKSYMLASPGERDEESPSSEVSLVLRGNNDGANLANIMDITSKDNNVFNDGKITYTSRYIQKDIKGIKLANLTDRDRVYVYRKVLLWEVTSDPLTKSQNEETGTQSGYALTAIPLNSNLAAVHPTVVGGVLINNWMDLGEAIYFMPRYNGYFYADGEIIKYDAVEFSISQPFETGSIVPTTTIAPVTITGATASGTEITYTSSNSFAEGDVVTISGITPSLFNLANVTVTESSATLFKVESTATGTYTSGGSATKYVLDTLNAGQNIVNLKASNADTLKLKVGQRLSKISGSGRFADVAVIASIASDKKSFTTLFPHAASGSIEFAAGLGESTKWITNTEEYQKYFAEVPFNGKMYPTGRVRIYAEPDYVDDTTLKNGPVLKSGRAQFNTNLTDHTIGLPDWVSGNESISGVEMESKFIFADTPITQKKLTVVNNGATTISLIKIVPEDRKYLRVGQRVTGAGIPRGTKVTKVVSNGIKTSKQIPLVPTKIIVSGVKIYPSALAEIAQGAAGFGNATTNGQDSKTIAKQSERSGVIRNYIGTPESFSSEINPTNVSMLQASRVQSSALSMTGPTLPTNVKPIDFASYVYKELDDSYKHFGTRMRIIGLNENNADIYQSPTGAMGYFSLATTDSKTPTIINGGSGGIGIFTDPTTNNGYFFELAALSVENVDQYTDSDNIANMIFYKVLNTKNNTDIKKKAVPAVMWSGRTSVTVDDGKFAGEYRVKAEAHPTVYDLGIEYKLSTNVDEDGDVTNTITFYLYVNNKLVGSVEDADPILNRKQNVCLFVRGTSKCMFENILAVKVDQASNYVDPYETPSVGFTGFEKETNFDPATGRYTLPKIIGDSYLKGISPITTKSGSIYFEEFGTIMREMAYFNIKYDKAFPAFISKILPTFNSLRGYSVGGFVPGAYGAEFLVFNTTDTVLELSEATGNFLRIGGITFTQQAQHEYTIDEYFQEKTNMSNPTTYGKVINSPISNKANYQNIKNSRIDYGRNEFNINAEYIQSTSGAENLMSWITKKIVLPRKSMGLEIFANPALHLGDIVTIDYQSGDSSIDAVTDSSTRFVVYSIDYSRDTQGPSMTIYVSQIPNVTGGSS
jgi:hypothetical protein